MRKILFLLSMWAGAASAAPGYATRTVNTGNNILAPNNVTNGWVSNTWFAATRPVTVYNVTGQVTNSGLYLQLWGTTTNLQVTLTGAGSATYNGIYYGGYYPSNAFNTNAVLYTQQGGPATIMFTNGSWFVYNELPQAGASQAYSNNLILGAYSDVAPVAGAAPSAIYGPPTASFQVVIPSGQASQWFSYDCGSYGCQWDGLQVTVSTSATTYSNNGNTWFNATAVLANQQ